MEGDDGVPRLLREYGSAMAPEPDRKAKTWAAIAAATGAAGAAASASAWQSASTKVLVASVSVALLGAGAAWVALGGAASVARESVRAPGAPVATSSTPTAEPSAPEPGPRDTTALAGGDATEETSESDAPPRAAARPARPRPRAARSSDPTPEPSSARAAETGSLLAELTLIREAQRAVVARDTAAALAALDQHAARYPAGSLVREREITRIRALCEARRTSEAERVAASIAENADPAVARALSRCAREDAP